MNTLILNSGAGTRMGELTSQHPKCMTEIQKNETISDHRSHRYAPYDKDTHPLARQFFENSLLHAPINILMKRYTAQMFLSVTGPVLLLNMLSQLESRCYLLTLQ